MSRLCFSLFVFLLVNSLQSAYAQFDVFTKPEFEKVTTAERSIFETRYDDVNWSGSGFRGVAVIDHIPTSEIRARLEKAFGPPTQKVDHLINKEDFRPGHYIQFEYWFIIDDDIPLMILDVDGPFSNGLVYAGASRHIDRMPEIKRTLSEILMEVEELGRFKDFYFDMDNETWHQVGYEDGAFSSEQIDQPQW